jgi:4-azaleucine resistance transporter AzlC
MNAPSTLTQPFTKAQALRFGALICSPMIVGGIPFGIIFGTLANNYGLPLWVIILMSSVVFAGSAQLVVLGLLAIGAPLIVIIATTFIVNLRHILYAADLLKYVRHLSLTWRAGLAFLLVDEVYAALRTHYQTGKLNEQTGHYAYLGAGLFFYLCWNLCTLLGVVAGQAIPQLGDWGLEFAMVVTFISIICPYLKSSPYWAVLIVSGLSSLLFNDMPNNLGLLCAVLLGLAAGFICTSLFIKKGNPQQPSNQSTL